jgi:hypothetical protein
MGMIGGQTTSPGDRAGAQVMILLVWLFYFQRLGRRGRSLAFFLHWKWRKKIIDFVYDTV